MANYSSGTVSVFPVDEHGALGPATDQRTFTGSGPNTLRQQESHPHQVVMDPLGGGIVVVDLGADRLHRLGFDRSSGLFSEGGFPILRCRLDPVHASSFSTSPESTGRCWANSIPA